jgi:hypothetical protein
MQPDPKQAPPTAQVAESQSPSEEGAVNWLARGQSAYRDSTSYVDMNYRKMWDDSIRAFNNEHPGDSKYNNPMFDKRSKLFRPKVRSVIRKNEAAAAAAFFSNMEVVSVEASDQSDPKQQASAEILQQLLSYRLKRTIPWFQLTLGGLQDAQTVGVACAHIYWEYLDDGTGGSAAPQQQTPAQYSMGDSGESQEDPAQQQAPQRPTPRIDRPRIDLIPVENLRVDPASDWVNPVESSPYVIHLMPMLVMDVKAKMDSGEWDRLDDNTIKQAQTSTPDSTRGSRNKDREDPATAARELDDYTIVWVQRHIHRDGFKGDVEFYMLGDIAMLTEARPLKDTILMDERPYVMGCAILETHKIMPAGVPFLGRGLQDEANDIVNQRIDNVKFVLNKKWFVRRGAEVDVGGLVRNVPGNIVMLNDPDKDVREITWPDVTSSAFEEQNRINLDMDELLGNFNPAGLMTMGAQHAPARNMAMLNQANGTLVEYMIRTYVETFIQPVLRKLVKLEQQYETDEVILTLCAKKAQLFERFGVDEITDRLLTQSVTVNVSVGMGATDPSQRLGKFMNAMQTFLPLLQKPVPGINIVEVGKEIFSHLGYQDGSRFFTMADPMVAQLQAALQGAQQQIAQMQQKLDEKSTAQIVGLQKTRETNDTKIQVERIRQDADNRRTFAGHFVDLRHPKPAPASAKKPGGKK